MTKNDGKAATYFDKLVKNQLARLKKRLKEERDNLGVSDENFPNKDAIWPGREVQDKWKEVKPICLWYFYMKVLLEDRFDVIGAVITNSDEKIEIYLIEKNQKRAHKEILEEDDTDRDLEDDKLDMYIPIY